MSQDADLSPPGAAEIIGELMSALGLDAATVVGERLRRRGLADVHGTRIPSGSAASC